MKPNRMNRLNWSRPAGIALTTALITVCATNALAVDWVGDTSSDWNDPLNWANDTLPLNNEPAAIQVIGVPETPSYTARISADSPFTPSEIVIGGWFATGRLDHTGGIVTTSTGGWPPGWILVGFGAEGNATYNLADTGTVGGELTGFGTGSGTMNTIDSFFLGEPNGGGNGNGLATVNINTTGDLNIAGEFFVGVNGWTGTVNLDQGDVTSNNIGVGRAVANVNYGNSTYTIPALSANGTLNVSGGSVTSNFRIDVGSGAGSGADSGSIGVVNQSGGTVSANSPNFWDGGVRLGAGVIFEFFGVRTTADDGSGTFNLDGGELITRYVFSEDSTFTDDNGTPDDPEDDTTIIAFRGTSVFNFNGGTLKPIQDLNNFWDPFMRGLTRANVRDGGAVIDTNGFAIRIDQGLMHSDIEGDAEIDGGLVKNGEGRLEIRNPSTFTGGVVVNQGTLYADVGNAPFDRAFSFASGITVNTGATLIAATNSLFGWDGSQAKPIVVEAGATATAQFGDQNVGLVTLNGGTLAGLDPDPAWGTWNFGRALDRMLMVTEDSAVTAPGVGFQGGSIISVAAEKTLTFSGTITDKPDGASSVIKWGEGTVVLSGANTYSGNTTVNEGTLEMTNPTLGDSSTLSLASDSGAILDLSHNSIDVVASLVYNGEEMGEGLYRAPDADGGSGDGMPLVGLTGTGKLNVGSLPSIPYADWASANVGGDPADVDTDLDGVTNGVEYFMNAAPGFTENPSVVTAGDVRTVTWTNGGNIPAADYGTQFAVQTSTDLDEWTPVESTDPNLANTDGSVSYTITGTGIQFVRLRVTPN